MPWTRREWMLAAGALPLEWRVLGRAPVQGRRPPPVGPLPPLGPPPALPDRASFPNIRGVSLNAAATHLRPAGADERIRRVSDAGLEAGGDRPDADRVRRLFAQLVNVDPDAIVFVPGTKPASRSSQVRWVSTKPARTSSATTCTLSARR